jgi:hypothetical protein
MQVYDKGQWANDKSISEEWKLNSSEGLRYEGYDSAQTWTLGIDYLFHVEVYCAADERFETAEYRYFVYISAHEMGDAVLVTDFPSLLMLMKEMLPLIQEGREHEAHEMQEEEHKHRMKQLQREGFKISCDH